MSKPDKASESTPVYKGEHRNARFNQFITRYADFAWGSAGTAIAAIATSKLIDKFDSNSDISGHVLAAAPAGLVPAAVTAVMTLGLEYAGARREHAIQVGVLAGAVSSFTLMIAHGVWGVDVYPGDVTSQVDNGDCIAAGFAGIGAAALTGGIANKPNKTYVSPG